MSLCVLQMCVGVCCKCVHINVSVCMCMQVLLRTLQSTNSIRYRHLIDELFSKEGTRVSEFSYFVDPQDTKRASQKKVGYDTMKH